MMYIGTRHAQKVDKTSNDWMVEQNDSSTFAENDNEEIHILLKLMRVYIVNINELKNSWRLR